ncbi:RHS repeat domain-containing protein [Pectobacterium odoriferum]
MVYEDGSETQFGYDVEGNLTAITDALGQRSPFRYGAFDNLLEATCAITTMRKRSLPRVKNNYGRDVRY